MSPMVAADWSKQACPDISLQFLPGHLWGNWGPPEALVYEHHILAFSVLKPLGNCAACFSKAVCDVAPQGAT